MMKQVLCLVPKHACYRVDGYWFTQHTDHQTLTYLCTLTTLPTIDELEDRAKRIVNFIEPFCTKKGITRVMLPNAPYLSQFIASELLMRGLLPVYPFSSRVKSGGKSMYEVTGVVDIYEDWIDDDECKA